MDAVGAIRISKDHHFSRILTRKKTVNINRIQPIKHPSSRLISAKIVPMQHIYSTWRSEYIGRDRENEGCAFCLALKEPDCRENLIFHRGKSCFVILNLFPYTSGHLMVVPYTHTNHLPDLPAETLNEMMLLVQKAVRVMEKVYHPHGFNIGLNLGSAAGAGIADRMHMHVVPRWQGDANFMSVIGETRVMREDLGMTYQRLSEAWQAASD